MRVIAGQFRSRRLKTLPGLHVRPTPDRLRESLFNILALEIRDAVFLDAYAGSGAVGIEAISRGARHAIFLERNPAAFAVIQENLAALRIGGQATVLRGNALVQMVNHPADIVFLDPPYTQTRDYQAALDALGATRTRLVIAQHDSHLRLPAAAGHLRQTRQVRQGSNTLSFYRPPEEVPGELHQGTAE